MGIVYSSTRVRQDSCSEPVDQKQKAGRQHRPHKPRLIQLPEASPPAYLDQHGQTIARPSHLSASQCQIQCHDHKSPRQTGNSGSHSSTKPSLSDVGPGPRIPASVPSVLSNGMGKGLQITRYLTRYTRCCGGTWHTGTSFAITASATESVVMDVTIASDESAICYRCLDRLRWRAWRLGLYMGEHWRLRSSVPGWDLAVGFAASPVDECGFDAGDEEEGMEEEERDWAAEEAARCLLSMR